MPERAAAVPSIAPPVVHSRVHSQQGEGRRRKKGQGEGGERAHLAGPGLGGHDGEQGEAARADVEHDPAPRVGGDGPTVRLGPRGVVAHPGVGGVGVA